MSDLTSAQIEQQINAAQSNAGNQAQPPTGQVTAVAPATPVPDQPGQVQDQVSVSASADGVNTPPQVEQKTAEQITLETLMKDKGMTDPNAIAASYVELQKKLTQTAMENAKLRAQTVPQPNPTVQPPQAPSMDAINQRFVEDLSRNPLETIAKVVNALAEEKVKPFHETQKEAKLNQEIIRLSTSPDTAQTFNLKEVQAEMTKVIEENPGYLDNLPQNLSLVHDIAYGRLSRRGFQVNAPKTVNSQPPTPEGGRNVPLPPRAIDIKSASSTELEAHINALRNRG